MRMSLFERSFARLLEADQEPVDSQQVTDKDAMVQTLDKGTSPQEFDVQGLPTGMDQARASHTAAQKKMLQEWIGKIQEFIEYLNGLGAESIQSKLHQGTCDTMFEKIASSEKKRISRVAMELSSLNESLKGYLVGGDD